MFAILLPNVIPGDLPGGLTCQVALLVEHLNVIEIIAGKSGGKITSPGVKRNAK